MSDYLVGKWVYLDNGGDGFRVGQVMGTTPGGICVKLRNGPNCTHPSITILLTWESLYEEDGQFAFFFDSVKNLDKWIEWITSDEDKDAPRIIELKRPH